MPIVASDVALVFSVFDTEPGVRHSVIMAKAKPQSLIPIERITAQIYLLRGQKVMLDFDLAKLYGVTTRALNQAVTRNRGRFPEDFMFQLSKEEFEYLRSQIVISSWGGRRYPPRAFTQEGVAMLSGVLRSKRAVEVNIDIMRAFVHLRRALDTNEELACKVAEHDQKINLLFEHIKDLLEPPELPPKPRIGFRAKDVDAER
ncbi:MAG: ORF6N domain-containing protein [Bryobacterales bacterium]|nr:ORF6N domain-containing protein [Bryobacterales bacterium]